MDGCTVTSFADDCGLLVTLKSVEQLCKRLERVNAQAVKCGKMNHVAFDNSKGEMYSFTRRQKSDLMQRLADSRITFRAHILGFNTEVTYWLVGYLDTGLQLKAHKNL